MYVVAAIKMKQLVLGCLQEVLPYDPDFDTLSQAVIYLGLVVRQIGIYQRNWLLSIWRHADTTSLNTGLAVGLSRLLWLQHRKRCSKTKINVWWTCYSFYSGHRYCGFCPQFKFQIGETFGRTTSRLLTNPNVACSGRPVLADISPAKDADSKGTSATARLAVRGALLRSRKASFGDQKLGERMVPGYTGKVILASRTPCFFG